MFKMSHVHSGVFLPAFAWHKFEVMTKGRNKLTQLTAVICIYDIELVGVIERLRQQRREKREAMKRVMLLPPLIRRLCLCFSVMMVISVFTVLEIEPILMKGTLCLTYSGTL